MQDNQTKLVFTQGFKHYIKLLLENDMNLVKTFKGSGRKKLEMGEGH